MDDESKPIEQASELERTGMQKALYAGRVEFSDEAKANMAEHGLSEDMILSMLAKALGIQN